MGCRLFIGSQGGPAKGVCDTLGGDRCYTAAHPPSKRPIGDVVGLNVLLDSGAFTDPPHRRLSEAAALERQLEWEYLAARKWGAEWTSYAIASYDQLIDETWVAGNRIKQRWSIQDAVGAVDNTVRAAEYIASQRATLKPRTLVLGVQGVDAIQYEECVRSVLSVAVSDDWIGLGGWCILGRFTSWLPTFWASMWSVLPLIARAGVTHVHLYGVLYQPAIGGLVWLADKYGLTVSNDSAAPILATTRGNSKKAGVRAEGWQANVAWWKHAMHNIRQSPQYRQPPRVEVCRQLVMGIA
jgi:hypothetical protein